MRNKLFCILLASCLCAACGGPQGSAEDAIRAWLAAGEAAVEAKDRGQLLDMISESYRDSRGNDREQIGNLLRIYFFRQQTISLLTSIDAITVSDDTAAMVNMTVGMAGTNASALGISADAYRFELELGKVDDEWLLLSARWGELGRDLR